MIVRTAVSVCVFASTFAPPAPGQGDRTPAEAAAKPSNNPTSKVRQFAFAPAWRRVAESFRAQCQRAQVVGGSLLFVRGNRTLGHAVFGYADRAGERRVDHETIYHWASITKTFTGIATMQLRDRKQLRLTQPIVELVPELRRVHDPRNELESITIRHLLSHSAGFRGSTWPWGGDQPWHPHEPTEFAQLVAMLPYTTIEFSPGRKFSYSNPGIVFVGQAIERLTGDDYEVFVDKNILKPLSMTRSYFDRTPYHLQRHRSHSYQIGRGEPKDLGPDFDTGVTVSNGGLNAPLPDMARYLAFLLGACPEDSDAARVLSRSSLESMWQPIVPTRPGGKEQMGLTFFLSEAGGTPIASHTGGQRSFVTFFYIHPASGTGALGAFNSSTGGAPMAAMRKMCIEQLSVPMGKH